MSGPDWQMESLPNIIKYMNLCKQDSDNWEGERKQKSEDRPNQIKGGGQENSNYSLHNRRNKKAQNNNQSPGRNKG